jgi:hypothetical protein
MSLLFKTNGFYLLFNKETYLYIANRYLTQPEIYMHVYCVLLRIKIKKSTNVDFNSFTDLLKSFCTEVCRNYFI